MDDASNILRDIERKVSVGDNQKSFNLLYSSVDKVNVDDFHVQCDGKGPTLTVLYGKYNTIFGGYTSQEWCSDKQRTKRDENAFLFYKNDHAEATCTFLPIKEKFVDRAITCDTNFGPTFGGGAFFWEAYDLQTFKKDNKKSESEREADSYMKLNGTVNFGCAYGLEDNQMPRRGASATRREARFEDSFRENCTIGTPRQKDINAGALVVKRIEVYQVVDDQLQEPWRTKPSDTEMEEIKKKLEKMEPLPGLGIKTYNILLVGVIGSGKSSFYNTLATVFMGAVKSHAPARDAPTSVTNKIHAYELKSKSGKPLNLRIFDIRGFEADRGYEHEIDLLLNGQLPIGFSFPDQPGPIQQEELVNASLKDEIHLVCFVTGTSNLDTITDDLHKRITSIQKSINRKGLPMVVVATKIDDLCQKISEDANRVYRSPKARDATKTVSNFFGIQEKYIFPIVNYVNDDVIKDGKDRLALQALNTMIELTRDYLENHKEMPRQRKPSGSKKARGDQLTNRASRRTQVADNLSQLSQNMIRNINNTSAKPMSNDNNHSYDATSSAANNAIPTITTSPPLMPYDSHSQWTGICPPQFEQMSCNASTIQYSTGPQYGHHPYPQAYYYFWRIPNA